MEPQGPGRWVSGDVQRRQDCERPMACQPEVPSVKLS